MGPSGIERIRDIVVHDNKMSKNNEKEMVQFYKDEIGEKWWVKRKMGGTEEKRLGK